MANTPQRKTLQSLYARRDILENLVELLQTYAPYAGQDNPMATTANGAIHLVKAGDAVPTDIAQPGETRVLMVSTEPVMCEGFRSLIASGSLRLVAVCTSMAQALQQLEITRPDVAIIHLNSPFALDEIPALLQRAPHCAVALWMDKVSTDMVARAVKMGARGILPTILSPEQVLESLLAIAQGEMRINLPAKICSPIHQQAHLSAGQRRLVSLIGQGLKNKEIATLMGSTEGTVKTSLNRLFKVLGAKDRFEVALYALQTQTATDVTARAPDFGGLVEQAAETRASTQ